MADIIELEQWEAGIYQLETDDPVLGGEDGIDNLQAKQLANRTKWLKAQLLLRALIESPAFTGTPTVPTAAPGTNNTQIANTAFIKAAIDAAIAGLIDSSPGALDTLNELAAALGDDPNFATTITNALALKAPWSTIDEVITEAGMIPDHGVLTQLRDAIQAMITASLAPDASETVKGIIEIATAAEAQAFAADKAIDGAKLAAALQGANQSFIAAGGYQKLPGGFIIQWGSRGMATAGDGSFPVTFPLTFPNGVLHASWTVQAGSLTQNVGTNISNITTSGMDLIVDKDSSQSTTFTGLWFTFGY